MGLLLKSIPERQALQGQHLGDKVARVMPDNAFAARVRDRLLEEMKKRDLTQVDIAGFLKWTQPRVSKILHGRVDLGVEELGELCFAIGIPVTEAVRDRGMEFCAEMTPTELRLLENLRLLDHETRAAFARLLNVKAPESRRAMPQPKRKLRNR